MADTQFRSATALRWRETLFAYLCGVATPRAWANNFHLPMIYAPGERIEAVTYHGVRITVNHAREVAIPG